MDTTSGNTLGGVHVVIGTDVRYEGASLPEGWGPVGTVIGIEGIDPSTRTAKVQFKSGADHVRGQIPVSELILLTAGQHSDGDGCQ